MIPHRRLLQDRPFLPGGGAGGCRASPLSKPRHLAPQAALSGRGRRPRRARGGGRQAGTNVWKTSGEHILYFETWLKKIIFIPVYSATWTWCMKLSLYSNPTDLQQYYYGRWEIQLHTTIIDFFWVQYYYCAWDFEKTLSVPTGPQCKKVFLISSYNTTMVHRTYKISIGT